MTRRVFLWSGPRNLSTALMYSFAQRSDTRVVDEPLYAHYLDRTPARAYHPAADAVLHSMERDGERVLRELLGPQARPVLFAKHMTHHLVDLDLDFLDQTANILLTRAPHDMLPSYAAVVENPTLADVGYAAHIELLEHLRSRGREPIVLDAEQILRNPESVLQTTCARLAIPWDPAMLSWPAGPRPEDGVWAPHWYTSVHRSTGFGPYRPKSRRLPEALQPLAEACEPLYARLRALAIEA